MTLSTQDRIVLLEFPDEAKAYVEHCRRQGMDPSASTVVSLNPMTHVWLLQHSVRCVNSLSFFTPESHARGLHKSEELRLWLESRFQITDGLGIAVAYANALVWYSRFFINHLLWLAEIVSEVQSQHPNSVVQALSSHPTGEGGPLLQDSERYLGWLAEEACRASGGSFQLIDGPLPPFKNGTSPGKSTRWLKWLGYRVGAHLHRSALRRMGRNRPLLALTRGYRMEALVGQLREQTPELPWTVPGMSSGRQRPAEMLRQVVQGIRGNSKTAAGQVFMAEVWPQVLQRATGEDEAFVTELTNKLNSLSEAITEERDLFSHRGVYFGAQVAAKIRNGIGPIIRLQHQEIRAIDEMLGLLRPRFVITPFGRRSSHALGELSQRRGIPGLLISHGSFTPIKDDLDKKAWGFHSFGMLHGSYSHAALQTPLARDFARDMSVTGHLIPTGPLSWGLKADRQETTGLKEKLLKGRPGSRIIVHAGTPKFRSGTHFHIYELPDEYIDGLNDLIQAVEQVPDAFLVVKFRPSQISEQELQTMLPSSDRYCVSVDEPFLDVLSVSDLLVSFSSTTIEEALQNQVPVLLYGGGGRYQHIEAFDVVPDKEVEAKAVYTIRRAEYLASGLKRILDVNGSAPLPENLFEQYVYKPEEITPFPQLVRELVRD